MAWYYVKSGGTATGDGGRYASEQSGSFATIGTSGYYDNIEAAFSATTAPASGDYIMVSDAHSHSYSFGFIIGVTSIVSPHVYIVSVSDTDITAYSAGAYEEDGGSGDATFRGALAILGMTFASGDDFNFDSTTSILLYDSSILTNGSAGTTVQSILFNDGPHIFASNGVFTSGSEIDLRGGATFEAYATELRTIQTTNHLFTGFLFGGGSAYLEGCDLSDITGTLVRNAGLSHADEDYIDVTIKNCQLNGSVTFANEAFTGFNMRLRIYNSASTSAAAEYQFYERGFGGEVEDQDDSGIHRDESTAFPSGTKVSAKVTTSTLATKLTPFYFDLITATVDLSAAASDVITIYFASTASLTDTTVWAELIYPDGTNKHIPNFLSNRGTDVLAAGTAHTDDSGSSTWKNGASDLTAYNEYRMTLETSGDAGADGVPTIRIYCGIASTTIYFDTTIGLS